LKVANGRRWQMAVLSAIQTVRKWLDGIPVPRQGVSRHR
jgi:hypothetical protein